MIKLDDFLKNTLRKYKKEEIIFIGLGNPFRSDDGLGIEFINRIKVKLPNAYTEFDNIDEIILNLCENQISGLVIFIDSTELNEKPGELKILEFDEIEDINKYFHKIPLKLYMKLLQISGKETYLLGIQPKSIMEIQETVLSHEISNKLDYLCNKFVNSF